MREHSSLPLWNPVHFGCQTNNNSIYHIDKDQPMVLFFSGFITPAEIKRKSPLNEWHCKGIDCLAAQISQRGRCLFYEFAKIQSLAFGLWGSRSQVLSVHQDWVSPKLESYWYFIIIVWKSDPLERTGHPQPLARTAFLCWRALWGTR